MLKPNIYYRLEGDYMRAAKKIIRRKNPPIKTSRAMIDVLIEDTAEYKAIQEAKTK